MLCSPVAVLWRTSFCALLLGSLATAEAQPYSHGGDVPMCTIYTEPDAAAYLSYSDHTVLVGPNGAGSYTAVRVPLDWDSIDAGDGAWSRPASMVDGAEITICNDSSILWSSGAHLSVDRTGIWWKGFGLVFGAGLLGLSARWTLRVAGGGGHGSNEY